MLWHSVVLMNEGFFDGLGKCLIVKISCQDLRFKHLNFLYIYPISYKIAKKANPEKRFAQIENDITRIFIDMIRVIHWEISHNFGAPKSLRSKSGRLE